MIVTRRLSVLEHGREMRHIRRKTSKLAMQRRFEQITTTYGRLHELPAKQYTLCDWCTWHINLAQTRSVTYDQHECRYFTISLSVDNFSFLNYQNVWTNAFMNFQRSLNISPVQVANESAPPPGQAPRPQSNSCSEQNWWPGVGGACMHPQTFGGAFSAPNCTICQFCFTLGRS